MVEELSGAALTTAEKIEQPKTKHWIGNEAVGPRSAETTPKSVKQFFLQSKANATDLIQRRSERNRKSTDELDNQNRKQRNREHFEENARQLQEAEKKKKVQTSSRADIVNQRRVSFGAVEERKITSSDDDDAFVAASDTHRINHSASIPLLLSKEAIGRLYKDDALVSEVKLVRDLTLITSVSNVDDNGDEENDSNDSTVGAQGSPDELNAQQPVNLKNQLVDIKILGEQLPVDRAADPAVDTDSEDEEENSGDEGDDSGDEGDYSENEGDDQPNDQQNVQNLQLQQAVAQAGQSNVDLQVNAAQIQLQPVDAQPAGINQQIAGQIQLQPADIQPAGNNHPIAGQVQLQPAGIQGHQIDNQEQLNIDEQPIPPNVPQIVLDQAVDGLPVDAPVDGLPVDAQADDGPPVDAPIDGLPVDAQAVDGLPVDAQAVDGLPVDAQAADGPEQDDEEYYDAVDNETEMAPNTPEKFNGLLSDDADSWIRYTKRWLSTQRTPNEATKIKMVALYLSGRALLWVDGLNIAEGP